MKTKTRRRRREIVLQRGRPSGIILDIDSYRDMLERLEDIEDVKELDRMRKKLLRFRKLDEFLRERSSGL